MVISAQWELVRGNSYGYTVLSAFGLFYAGFGALDIPFLGITAAYGSDTVEYNNALGFFVLCESSQLIRTFCFVLNQSHSVVCLQPLFHVWIYAHVSRL